MTVTRVGLNHGSTIIIRGEVTTELLRRKERVNLRVPLRNAVGPLKRLASGPHIELIIQRVNMVVQTVVGETSPTRA